MEPCLRQSGQLKHSLIQSTPAHSVQIARFIDTTITRVAAQLPPRLSGCLALTLSAGRREDELRSLVNLHVGCSPGNVLAAINRDCLPSHRPRAREIEHGGGDLLRGRSMTQRDRGRLARESGGVLACALERRARGHRINPHPRAKRLGQRRGRRVERRLG
jgi:hypothetical protein